MIKIEAKANTINTNDGKRSFLTWTAYTKTGYSIRLKFTRDVDNIPTEEGFYTLTVDPACANINKQKRFPELWVKNVVKFEKGEIARAERNIQRMIDMFFMAVIIQKLK